MATTASIHYRHRATGLRNLRQRVAHVVVLFGGWGLFAWGWARVLQDRWDTRPLLLLIVGSLVLLPLVTVFWIAHNKRIYRIKGPRSGVPKVDEAYREDWNGRRIEADWAQLAHADLVIVDVVDGRKTYRAARTQPGDAPTAARHGDAALAPGAVASETA